MELLDLVFRVNKGVRRRCLKSHFGHGCERDNAFLAWRRIL